MTQSEFQNMTLNSLSMFEWIIFIIFLYKWNSLGPQSSLIIFPYFKKHLIINTRKHIGHKFLYEQ